MNQSTKWLYFWVVFVLATFQFGLVFSFGALFPSIRDTFLTDRPTTATVQALLMGITTSFGVVSGVIINKFGLPVALLVSSICMSSGFAVSFIVTDIWYLYATIGVLGGIGTSLFYVSFLTVINRTFKGKQRAWCIAIQGPCPSIAGLFYPYLLDELVSTYGVRGTFLVIGGVFCNSFVFSLMVWFRRSDFTLQPEDKLAEQEKHYYNTMSNNPKKEQMCASVGSLFKGVMTKRYICLLVAATVSVGTADAFLDFVFDISHWKGFDNSEANMVFVFFNICGIIFCIVPGLIQQVLDIDTYLLPFGLALFACSGCLIVMFADTYVMYAIGLSCMSAVFGLVACAFIICANLVRLEHVNVAIGLIMTLGGLLSIGMGPIYGVIRDNTGSYNSVFPIFATAQGIAAVLLIEDFISRKLKKQPMKDVNNVDNISEETKIIHV
ncbi:monocarboxylate transporter 12-like isoform X1 [Ruditapes philippinarum]|uniref:monocarboxylate transporter 12-like isoform X1 n=1 Tax=Ruditapes philippinarum TaxID=129788 RepID=UPI00295A5D8F|nr:monocarboxylate transporter 12-like isoform X1 [Ruditapes philippinarum]